MFIDVQRRTRNVAHREVELALQTDRSRNKRRRAHTRVITSRMTLPVRVNKRRQARCQKRGNRRDCDGLLKDRTIAEAVRAVARAWSVRLAIGRAVIIVVIVRTVVIAHDRLTHVVLGFDTRTVTHRRTNQRGDRTDDG